MASQQSQFTVSSSSTNSTSTTDNNSSPPIVTESHSPVACPPSALNVDENLKEEISEKLLHGQYQTLKEMATSINRGQESELVKQVTFKNMMCIMLEEFKQ